ATSECRPNYKTPPGAAGCWLAGGIMKILEAKLANNGTVFQGIAVSTRGRRYRWFVWSNGCLSVDREEEEPLWPGSTHWRSLWGLLGEMAVKVAIRAAVADISGTKRYATARSAPPRLRRRGPGMS